MEKNIRKVHFDNTVNELRSRIVIDKSTRSLKRCPGCGERNLRPFVDIQGIIQLDDSFGICKKGRHCYCKPLKGEAFMEVVRKIVENEEDFFVDKTEVDETFKRLYDDNSFDYFDSKIMEPYLYDHSGNNFVEFLLSLFDPSQVFKTLNKYRLGSFSLDLAYEPPENLVKCPIFWYIDFEGRVRSGKVVLYKEDGTRYKEGRYKRKAVNWFHTMYNKGISDKDSELEFKFKFCYFGSHLVRTAKKVKIVESEKTAIIMDIVSKDKDAVWIATGSISSLLPRYLEEFYDKEIIVYPDADSLKKENVHENWLLRVQEADMQDFNIKCDPLCQDYTYIKENCDPADIIIQKYQK